MLRTTAMTGRTACLSSAASRLPSTTMRQALIKRVTPPNIPRLDPFPLQPPRDISYNPNTTLNSKTDLHYYSSNVLPIPPTSNPVPPRIVGRHSLTRKVLSPLALLALTFYGVSIPLGYTSLRYRDFLVESVPGGELIGDALDKYELDRHHVSFNDLNDKVDQALSKSTNVSGTPLTTKSTTPTAPAPTPANVPSGRGWQLKKGDKADPIKAREEIKAKAEQVAQSVSEATQKAKERANEVGGKVEQVKVKVGQVVDKASSAVKSIVPKVEEPESTLPVFAQRPRQLDATPIPPKKAPSETPYDVKPIPTPPQPLPLVAPVINSDEKAASEPMLGQLASTIDSLAKFVENSDESKASAATGVLKSAQDDLKTLAARLQAIKNEGESTLSTSLDQEDWKKAFEEERKKLVDAYKTKLQNELETQQALIDQRLKEEVIAQGVELQRRWVDEIKLKVEQERGGRLAKLDQLEGGIRKLEKVTQGNVDSMTMVQKARKLQTAVKAVEHAIESGRPFINELNALKKLAKESADQAPILDVALSTIDESIASSGVTSFPSLASRFTNSVAFQLKKVSLLPEHAGVLSYVQSYLLSYLLFERKGWAEGSDVVSVIARAKFHLLNKDLDQATREVNSLQGWPKALARDWLNAARGHLEVQQALSVVEAETTVQGLKAL
ncbi:BQ5605_C077g12950 [Microbotryum silenes-dioicae]|uniref:MICOS complex subunit MIC60 n=1 Tax=Microbotryum silenes-dioicae TaxID=796604 RepID=A0A2X0PJC9_9BASI|nr:BQ5605_C077g12950 [Microbotryum silenes-dioicae]